MTDQRPDATDTWTAEQVVGELAEMVRVSRTSPTITQRLLGQTLVVLYEFTEPDGNLSPYLMRVGDPHWSVEPGSVDPAKADIVIRASPSTLHRLTSGALGGREAIVSGLLDIRKAPSMPKLLLMRALFNRHRKAMLRGVDGSRGRVKADRAGTASAGGVDEDAPVRP